jgi:hypothetical protein
MQPADEHQQHRHDHVGNRGLGHEKSPSPESRSSPGKHTQFPIKTQPDRGFRVPKRVSATSGLWTPRPPKRASTALDSGLRLLIESSPATTPANQIFTRSCRPSSRWRRVTVSSNSGFRPACRSQSSHRTACRWALARVATAVEPPSS